MNSGGQKTIQRLVLRTSCPVSILILIFVGTGLLWLMFNTPSHIPVKWINILVIDASLARFKAIKGRYPTEDEGLSALVRKPQSWGEDENWKKLLDEKHLKDGWGNSIQYRLKPPGKPYGLYSFGEDGVSESDGEDSDDINNWAKTKSNRYFVEAFSIIPPRFLLPTLAVFIKVSP